jgi:ubiquitin
VPRLLGTLSVTRLRSYIYNGLGGAVESSNSKTEAGTTVNIYGQAGKGAPRCYFLRTVLLKNHSCARPTMYLTN